MECEECYGSGEVCSECERAEGYCDCDGDVDGEPPELMTCPECGGDGYLDEEDDDLAAEDEEDEEDEEEVDDNGY